MTRYSPQDYRGEHDPDAPTPGYDPNTPGEIERLRSINTELVKALQEIHKFWLCPEPTTLKGWSARCDVMNSAAEVALQKAGLA